MKPKTRDERFQRALEFHMATPYHEAGHVIVSAVALGPTHDSVSVSDQLEYKGKRVAGLAKTHNPIAMPWRETLSNPATDPKIFDLALRNIGVHALCLAAGRAAQVRFNPQDHRGLGGDREAALRLMEQLVPDHADRLCWWRSVNRVADRVVAIPETWDAICNLASEILFAEDYTIEGDALLDLVWTPEVTAAQKKAEPLLNLAPPRRCRLWHPGDVRPAE